MTAYSSTAYSRICRRVSASPRTTGSIGTPTFSYSPFISSDSAQKCGGVQKNTMKKSSTAVALIEPVTAAHPTSGGTAPAAPPITMFCGVRRFSHTVYTSTYPRKPANARLAASTLTASESSRNESAARQQPNVSAAVGAIRPAGIGRVAVRAMRASMSRSNQWLTAPAPPAER